MDGNKALQEYILSKSIPVTESGCWLWLGSTHNKGYGDASIKGNAERAHRVSYRAFIGQIPEGLMVCHSCDVRLCVNPQHLFVGTAKDNIWDAINKGRFIPYNTLKTHCGKGHVFNAENTLIRGGGKWRGCRECDKARKQVRP